MRNHRGALVGENRRGGVDPPGHGMRILIEVL